MSNLIDVTDLSEEQIKAIAPRLLGLLAIPPEVADPARLESGFVEKWQQRQKRRRPTPWQRVVCRVPGTKNFRRWFAQQAISLSNASLFLFFTLKSVPFAKKKETFRRLKRLEHQVAKYEALQQFATNELGWAIVVVGMILSLFLPPALAEGIVGASALNWGSLLTFIALYIPTVRLSVASLKGGWGTQGSLWRLIWSFLVWPTAFVAVFAWVRHKMFERQHSQLFTHCAVGLAASLLAVAVIWAAVALAAAVGRAVILLVEARKKRKCSAVMAVDGILLTLYALDKKKFHDLSKAATKGELVPRIEDVAVAIERVSSGMPAGDAATEWWLKNEMAQIACAVRSLKKWVLTPKADTYAELYGQLANTLRLIVAGDWDSMPREVPGKISRSMPSRKRILDVLAAVVVALLSILAVVAVPHSPLAPLVTTGNLLIGGSVWVLIVVLAMLDPEKIRNLREILQLSATMGKKG